jgi:hypothetical protein
MINMNILKNISEVYIVEDNLHSEHETALVFPRTLIEEEAIDLKNSFINTKVFYESLWEKIVCQLKEEHLENELLFFIENKDQDSFVKLNEWYVNGGQEKWESIWRGKHYKDEYSFLDKLPVKKDFKNYEDAILYVKENKVTNKNKSIKLWFLDRELGDGNFRDNDILSLLDLLSVSDDSIGIIYSAKTEALQTKDQIYKYVKTIVDESKPTDINDSMKDFLAILQSQHTNSLFLESESFISEMSNSFTQMYESKADLNNLVWVMGKKVFLETDSIIDMIQKAIHGFELYKLLKLHTVEKKRALTNGLLYTTKLELEDIEHLKNKSIIEGTNISNTLIRINDIYSSQAFNKQLSERKDYFSLIKKVEAWKQEVSQKTPSINFNELLSMEKFDYSVNSLFKPIMTGDIFEVYSTSSGNGKNSRTLYMLVTQECDCVIRKNGGDSYKRSVDKATLIEMDIVKDPIDENVLISELLIKLENGIDDMDKRDVLEKVFKTANKQVAAANEKRLSLAPLLANEQYNNTTLLLRKTLHVNFKLLDLCMLNSSGETKMDLTNSGNIKTDIVSLYPKFYQEYLKNLIDEVISVSRSNNEIFKKKIEERNLENYFKIENTLDYRLRRVARVNMPHQAFVQAYYGLTQSNVGLPMDL